MKGKLILKLMLLIAAVMTVAGGLFANSDVVESPRRPKVALVLCGGGAKGAAHVGVLKVLEEADVPIDMIVGTSIGGLVGGLYSMGYNAAQLDSIVRGCNWKYLLSDNSYSRQDESFDGKSQDTRYLIKVPFYGMSSVTGSSPVSRLPSGLISGQNILNLLNGLAMRYQEDMEFKDLPIPFACIATNLSTGEAVVLDSGKLPIAMRATMAIPGVFSPVEIDGQILVDGGVVNNFPVDVARNMGADIVIGVDIKNDSPEVENLRALPQVLVQMINLMGSDTHQRNVADVDILIKPDVSKYSTFSFNDPAVAQLIINGEVAAREKYGILDTLARRLNTISVLEQMQHSEYKPAEAMRDTFCFKSVSIVGVEKKNEHWLRRMSGLKPGVDLTITDINRGVSILMGTKAFSSVTYTVLAQGTEDESLLINIKKGPTNVVALGARYDSEEAAGLLFHVGANELGLLGSKIGFTSRLSYNPYGEINYSYTSKDFPKIEFNYKVGGMDMNIYKSTENQNNLSFIYQTGELNLANIYLRNFDFKLGARYEHYDFSKYLKQNIPDNYQEYSLEDSSYESFYFRGRMDTRDDDYFATGGMLVDVEGTFWQSNYTRDFEQFGAVKLILNGAIRAGERLVFLPQYYGRVLLGECKEIPYVNYIGGSEPGRYLRQQLPFIGIDYANPVSSAVMIGRFDARLRLGSNHYIYSMANYMRFASGFADVFSTKGYGIWGLGVKYAYNTPVGPLSLNVHWSDFEHKFGVYVSLGHYF